MQDWGNGPSSAESEKKVIEIKNHLKNKFPHEKMRNKLANKFQYVYDAFGNVIEESVFLDDYFK